MAGKKLPKDVDFAAGFFCSEDDPVNPDNNNPDTENPADETVEAVTEKITAPAPTTEKPTAKNEPTEPKNLGGRPKKDGLKNEQFTLTMNPETYEKLRIVAEEHTRGNFSGLIDEAIKAYCREKDINLAEIEVDPQILEMYRQKQAKKSKKK